MGTRGLYGIRKGNVDKCTYNHWDSYPRGLGRDMLEFCATHSEEQINHFYDLIELVDKNEPPTKLQIQICRKNGYNDYSITSNYNKNWYYLLRNLQGNIKAWDKAINKNAYIFMVDDSDFIKDSLFCEYAYIINCDTHRLEYWIGFQEEPSTNNRYGQEEYDETGYYPCKLVAEFNLDFIKTVSEVKNKIKIMEEIINEDEN